MARFVERAEMCEHWRGEEPYDDARRAEIDRNQRDLRWLAERSPGSAAIAARAIFDAVGRLGRHPLSGWSIDSGERETKVRFGRFGFIVRYEVRPGEVVVVHVFHNAQDRSVL